MLYEKWDDDWLDIIRDVIYPDETLKTYMCVPEDTTILGFIENYFIPAGSTTSELLTNEDTRIVYGFYVSGPTNIQNAHEMTLSFDIYCRKERLYDVDDADALVQRTQRIARRLNQLLYLEPRDHSNGFVGVYRFYDPREGPLGTRTIGYERYNLSFTFQRYY